MRGLAPHDTASREISASPLVMKAALALLPIFIPSQMPAPSAMMFFRAPPSSTPIMSLLVYTLKKEELSMFCTIYDDSWLLDATTVEEGFESIISWARFGPDSAHILSDRLDGSSSFITSLILLPELISSPLVALTTVADVLMESRITCKLSLIEADGTATMTISASMNASRGEDVIPILSGNRAPGKRRAFSPSSRNRDASLSVRAHIWTGTPNFDKTIARVVPQLVVPVMPTLVIVSGCQPDMFYCGICAHFITEDVICLRD